MLNHYGPKHICQSCGMRFHRRDYLAKHTKRCKSIKTDNKCDMCDKIMFKKSNLTRHKNVCRIKQEVMQMKEASKQYRQKLEKGLRIEQILRKCPDTMEEALKTTDRDCLKLFQLYCQDDMNISNITLRPWQKEVVKFIERPCERSIFWIMGTKGNEGKSFIQKYICQQYGMRRAIKSEINTRKEDIAYTLTEHMLTCKDIFLFNLLRSYSCVAYGLLENLKDGYLMSSKYRSKSLKIKTPKTVMVFSNSLPFMSQLSKDRWKIFEINGDYLKECNSSYTLSDSDRKELQIFKKKPHMWD